MSTINGVPVADRLGAVRELLRQRGIALGFIGADAADKGLEDGIEALLEREVKTPEPTAGECRRFYAHNQADFTAGELVFARHILFALTPGVPVGPLRSKITSARQALDTGIVNRVLIWVQHTDEAQIKDAFRKTIEVRELNPSARELADNYFFETLVRVHRAGEGAPYTGIKPAGRDLGPAVPAGDKALETGSVEPLAQLLTQAVHKSVGGNSGT